MMEAIYPVWHPGLADPSGQRSNESRTRGKTMVIDKGLGLHAFEDLLNTSAAYIDIIKFGFGTACLYPATVLKAKIRMARERGITVIPGGTFLEVAISRNLVDDYFETVLEFGFDGIEISDGTIEMDRNRRNGLIERGLDSGLMIFTEYGKKGWGSRVEVDELVETVISDIQTGAQLVAIEGRESGAGVGIYDEHGICRDDDIDAILEKLPNAGALMWETPRKEQQVHMIRKLGAGVHLGNIAPQDVLALEALRRGLRSDTFVLP